MSEPTPIPWVHAPEPAASNRRAIGILLAGALWIAGMFPAAWAYGRFGVGERPDGVLVAFWPLVLPVGLLGMLGEQSVAAAFEAGRASRPDPPPPPGPGSGAAPGPAPER